MKLDEEMLRTMKYLRKKKKITQAKLAENAGISLKAYQNYEQGKRDMPLEAFLSVFESLGFDIDINIREIES